MAYRDPNAPIIARLFATNTPPNERIEIDSYRNEGPNTGSQIRFYRGSEPSNEAAKILLTTTGLAPDIKSILEFQGSDIGNDGIRAEMFMTDFTDGHAEISFGADKLWLNRGIIQADVNGDGIQMWDTIAQTGERWKWPGFVNAWGDLAGSRAAYWMDATGVVHLRGIVIGGTAAATITTIPLGYRPSQTMDFTVRQAGGVIVCAFQINSVTGALTASGNASTVSGSGARLDGITWPTHSL